MPVDSRKEYILTTAANFFGKAATDDSIASSATSSALNDFLDDGGTPVLAARMEGKAISFLNKVESNDSNDSVIVFFKVRPDVITPDNIHTNIFVSSMMDSPVSALYHAVQKVFAPVLLNDAKWSRTFDPKLQSLLSELEAGLGSIVRKEDPSAKRHGGDDESSFAGILTPVDEFHYWSDATQSARKGDARERAECFRDFLHPISKEFSGLGSMTLVEIMELVELTQDTLDDLWKQMEHEPLYPENRMKHLLDIIGNIS